MFKIGDIVKCVNADMSGGGLTKGKMYTITTGNYENVFGDPVVEVESDKGKIEYFAAARFIQAPPIKIPNISGQELDDMLKKKPPAVIATLPTDSKERKNFPLFSGLLRYFPAALAGVARTSKLGNDKHNPGEEMHHARGKSMDHGDCILRHLMDVEDLMAARARGEPIVKQAILDEANQMAWRALALSQELHEKLGAPLAPGAKK